MRENGSPPQIRLVVLAAAIALPALTLAGIAPLWILPCSSLLAVCLAIAIIDLVRGRRLLERISVSLPEVLRLTKNVAGVLPITLHTDSALHLRLAAPMPEGVESSDLVARHLHAGRRIADRLALHRHIARRPSTARHPHRGGVALALVGDARGPPVRLHPPRLPQPARPCHRRAVSQDRRPRIPPPPPGGKGPGVRQPAPLPSRRQLRRYPLESHRPARLPHRQTLSRGARPGSLRGHRFLAPFRAARNSRQLRRCRAASRPSGRAAGRPFRAGHVQRPHAPLRARAQRHGSLPPVPRNYL